MKILEIKLFVTNAAELITGLNLVNDVDIKFDGLKLVVGDGAHMPITPKPFKDKVICVKTADLLNDIFMVQSLDVPMLIHGPEGVIYIGEPKNCEAIAKHLKAGKVGRTAYGRGFWSCDNTPAVKALAFIGNDFVEEKPAEEPAPEKKPVAKKPKKPAAKKPEDKPAEEPKKPLTLQDLILNPEEVIENAAEEADEKPAEESAEESAEEALRRMCEEADVEYDLADSSDDADEDGDA